MDSLFGENPMGKKKNSWPSGVFISSKNNLIIKRCGNETPMLAETSLNKNFSAIIYKKNCQEVIPKHYKDLYIGWVTVIVSAHIGVSRLDFLRKVYSVKTPLGKKSSLNKNFL